MAANNIPPTSFMNLFAQIVYDKTFTPNYSLDIWDSYVLDYFNKKDLRYFSMHKVSAGESWVSLARYYYNEERLWWIIPLYNDVENPFMTLDMNAKLDGVEQLQILKPEFTNQLLLAMRQNKIIADRNTATNGNDG